MRMTEEQYAAWKDREAARSLAPTAGSSCGSGEPTAGSSARIVLPWPPSGNHGTRHANGAHYLTREHIDYRAKVLELVTGLRLRPVAGRLRVTLHIAPPDRRRRDLDNVAKTVLDSCQHAGMYRDDCAIDELHLIRTPVVAGGAVHALVEAIDG